MAFPSTPILDSFAGTLAGWTNPAYGNAAFTITAGQLAATTSGFSSAVWATTFGPDMEVYLDIPVANSSVATCNLQLRVQDTTSNLTGYVIFTHNLTGVLTCSRYVAGTPTAVTMTGTLTYTSGDSIGASIVGSTITVYKKPAGGVWTAVATGSDSGITGTGFIGLDFEGTEWRGDNFGGGDLTPWLPLATDDFNRSDGTLNTAGWTDFSSNGVGPGTMGGAPMAISSNKVVIDNANFDGASIYTGYTWKDDQYASCSLTSPGVGTLGEGQGIIVRASFPGLEGQGYRLIVSPNAGSAQAQLGRFSGGSFHILTDFVFTHADGDIYTLRVTGQGTATALEVFQNGTLIGTYSDNGGSAINSGSPGVAYSSTRPSSSGDNWEGGQITSSLGSVPIGFLQVIGL